MLYLMVTETTFTNLPSNMTFCSKFRMTSIHQSKEITFWSSLLRIFNTKLLLESIRHFSESKIVIIRYIIVYYGLWWVMNIDHLTVVLLPILCFSVITLCHAAPQVNKCPGKVTACAQSSTLDVHPNLVWTLGLPVFFALQQCSTSCLLLQISQSPGALSPARISSLETRSSLEHLLLSSDSLCCPPLASDSWSIFSDFPYHICGSSVL